MSAGAAENSNTPDIFGAGRAPDATTIGWYTLGFAAVYLVVGVALVRIDELRPIVPAEPVAVSAAHTEP